MHDAQLGVEAVSREHAMGNGGHPGRVTGNAFSQTSCARAGPRTAYRRALRRVSTSSIQFIQTTIRPLSAPRLRASTKRLPSGCTS
jgi:hypothetical protein